MELIHYLNLTMVKVCEHWWVLYELDSKLLIYIRNINFNHASIKQFPIDADTTQQCFHYSLSTNVTCPKSQRRCRCVPWIYVCPGQPHGKSFNCLPILTLEKSYWMWRTKFFHKLVGSTRWSRCKYLDMLFNYASPTYNHGRLSHCHQVYPPHW